MADEEPKPYIPLSLRLPFGYRIKIVQVERVDAADSDGEWSAAKKSIKIKEGLSEKRKLAVFLHECLHAGLDWTWDIMDRFGVLPE